MFFRSSRREPAHDIPVVPDACDAGNAETAAPRTQRLVEWRRSAQRVRRTWNAWLASEGLDRSVRYRAFVAALADEERAATEVARTFQLAQAGRFVTTADPRQDGFGAQ